MLSPAEFVDFYAQVGAKKARNSTVKLFLAAVLAGMLAGFVTGFFHTVCGIPAILAGILWCAACCSPSG